jgi:hypothetical protein
MLAYGLGQVRADVELLNEHSAEFFQNLMWWTALIAFVSVSLGIIGPGLKALDRIAYSKDGVVPVAIAGSLVLVLLVAAPAVLAVIMALLMGLPISTAG